MSYFRLKRKPTQKIRQRIIIFIIFCAIAWLIILAQLWRLQVTQHQMYAELSLNNRIRIKRIKASRGLILDRNGAVLVSNRPGFYAALILEDAGKHLDESLVNLSKLLGVPVEHFQERIHKAKADMLPFLPLRLTDYLTSAQVAVLEEHQIELPGITVAMEPVRSYHYGTLAAHVFGYVSEITESQMSKSMYKGVRRGDFIGQYGMEKSYNSYLTGEDGGKQVEVNAEGREIQVLGQRQPLPGLNLVLTIDAQLQIKAESLMQGKKGAVIAIDPNNGEVLAMVSSPSFDPNTLSTGISRDKWKELIENPDNLLLNRAIQSQYPSGSVFKIVMMAAGMDNGVLSRETSHFCSGKIRMGRWTYSCWREHGHGSMSLMPAITQSCNVFFYNVGQGLGVDKIAASAYKFGLGRPTGIDLLNERGGLVPTPQWKKRTFKVGWLPGETISLSIGQGYLGVTPLQLANLIAAVASKGTLYRPHLVKEIVSAEGQVERVFHPEVLSKVNLSPDHWQTLQEGLRDVVSSPRGTGGKANIPGIPVAGKTGTAQVVAKRPDTEKKVKEEDIPEQFRDNAWFVAYAPADEGGKPLIAMAVLVEHGGHGGSACAPIAHDLILEYLNLRFPQLVPEASRPIKPLVSVVEEKLLGEEDESAPAAPVPAPE